MCNKADMIVTADHWITKRLGSQVFIIENVRHFKFNRWREPVAQVQLLGYPMRWLAAAHFHA